MLQHGNFVAVLISGFYMLREVSFLVRGEPVSALAPGSAPAQMGDCLPSQAVLGGQFRLAKADLEETGRAVFVPARPRSGLYVGSGLAMLGHLVMGMLQGHATPLPPLMLLGALIGLAGRTVGDVPALKGSREKAGIDTLQLWRREGPRLLCRVGELVWVGLLIVELRRAEAHPAWLT